MRIKPELLACDQQVALIVGKAVMLADFRSRKKGRRSPRARTMREAIELFFNLLWKDPASGCWHFCGKRDKWGYGDFRSGYQIYKAHRFAWILSGKEIPDGHGVLHKCDNPPCCNPAHLFTGTQLDNVRDCVAKGRHKGRDRALTKKQRLEVLCEPRTWGYQTRLAKQFGVSQQTISNVILGKTP